MPAYVVGDSLSPFISRRSSQARLHVGAWLGGTDAAWLRRRLDTLRPELGVSAIVVSTGTNTNFSPADDARGLLAAIGRAFPGARVLMVPGSWGWGANLDTTIGRVNAYYQRFAALGATIISPPIGRVEPHRDLPVYERIGSAIDCELTRPGSGLLVAGVLFLGFGLLSYAIGSRL